MARKMPYKLQKFGLILTCIDAAKDEWHMLMPNSVRESLTPDYKTYLDLAETGTRLLSKKQLRMVEAMNMLMGQEGAKECQEL